MFRINRVALAAAAAAVTLPLALVGCSSTPTGSPSTGSSSAPGSSASAPASSTAPSSPESSTSATTASAPFGPACDSIPKTGKGSFDGMSIDPVATAASNNPALSTLVTAVKAAGLVDTLNSQQAITVFAPANSAFDKVDPAALKKLLGDKTALTGVLTYHVVAGRIAPDQLAGDHKTLQGTTVSVTGSGESFKVNGSSSVVCGNVQTANATVYIIDTVLMPKS